MPRSGGRGEHWNYKRFSSPALSKGRLCLAASKWLSLGWIPSSSSIMPELASLQVTVAVDGLLAPLGDGSLALTTPFTICFGQTARDDVAATSITTSWKAATFWIVGWR